MCASIPDRRYVGHRLWFDPMIMIESEGITENVHSWRTDVISAINTALPIDKIM
jgi:phosphosulfolactate synthase (CoM biosynthesis protein A)